MQWNNKCCWSWKSTEGERWRTCFQSSSSHSILFYRLTCRMKEEWSKDKERKRKTQTWHWNLRILVVLCRIPLSDLVSLLLHSRLLLLLHLILHYQSVFTYLLWYFKLFTPESRDAGGSFWFPYTFDLLLLIVG